MSYIYEALKRAENENARAVGASHPVRRPIFLAARRRWWVWLLIGVFGVNAALLVTLVLVRGSRSPEVMIATTTSDTGGAPAGISPPGAESGPVTSSATADAAAPPAPEPLARTVAPPPRVARRPVTPPIARVDPSPHASTPSAVTRETTEARPPSPPTPGATEGVSRGGAPVIPPATVSPSQNTPASATDRPTLQIQVVLYSDVPAERMVIIDGRRFVEGDRIDAETVVERITPEGAVIIRRGQRFALTSGPPR